MDDLGNFNHTCNHTFNDEQTDAIIIAMGAAASVSCLMCVATVSSVLWLKFYKHFTYRLAMYQVASSMLFSMDLIFQLVLMRLRFHNSNHKSTCEVAGFLLEYFMWVKLLITVSLVIHIFILAVCLKHLVKLELFYVFFSIFFPFLFVWIPFIKRSYGMAGAWCWIKDWKGNCANKNYIAGILEQFMLWYVPQFFSLAISIVVIVIILIILIQRVYFKKGNCDLNSENEPLLKSHNNKALKKLVPLLFYPIAFFLLNIIALIHRIYDVVSNDISFKLTLAHSLSIGAWGFFSSWALLLHIILQRKMDSRNAKHFGVHPASSHSSVVEGKGVPNSDNDLPFRSHCKPYSQYEMSK